METPSLACGTDIPDAFPAGLATLTSLQLSVAAAQLSNNSAEVAFVQNTVYGNITFAPIVAQDVGDLYFHLEAPAENSWVAVGIGSEMKGSLIWVFYRNQTDKGMHKLP